ncbi:MAG: hypothetical protein KJO40_10400 [Deltaproteobacteria bacterium]|nr:hypothetical protein [Deltaproteobacteria bacterium]NND29786.1 hypothetical protein [Myxococcales bacterium]MBT8463801.1 hypothetical protein [Deltaproteobacteria bacterium]MBT8480754.1 hypothetical protein [Deltaproteobacteria bacterium]NNK05697.1 hypothetical protein [Myxococcales bacterium]
MWSPKKSIPRLAVAALPLAGFGCGGGTGAAPEVNLEALTQGLQAFCVKVIECYELNNSVDECVEYYRQYYESGRYSPACLSAYASYFSCLGGLTCEQFVLGEGDIASTEADACLDAEIDTINAECPPI